MWSLKRPSNLVTYQVGEISKVLSSHPERTLEAEAEADGRVRHFRVVHTRKGTKLYAGILAELWFDPARWRWDDAGGLHTYMTKRGQKLLSTRLELLHPIP
jgi:hypothetical protein